MDLVPAEGPLDAKICIIGEAPWRDEVAQGRPFAGASGNKLAQWWHEVGLSRSQMRIENVCHIKPPRIEIDSHPTGLLVEWMRSLHTRIAQLYDPVVLVPMGNYATFALTGKGKVRAAVRNEFSEIQSTASEADKKAGITKLRGSIYPYRDLHGRLLKVVPTIHPAAVLRHAKWERRTIADWKRVRQESFFREYLPPTRNMIIEPTEWEVEQYVKFIRDNEQSLVLALDIETWGNRLSCVGFSYTASESITIDVSSKEKMSVFLPYIQKLCECGAQKALCNGLFDWYWLDAYGVQIRNFIWDVQLMHHAIDPVENHALDFLASIYTKQSYWKCLPGDVEVLTRAGWLPLEKASYCPDTEIMASDEMGTLFWDIPEAYTVTPAKDFDLLKIRSLRHNCEYSYNHRLLVESQYTGKRKVLEAGKLPCSFKLVSSGYYVGGTSSEEAIDLLVAIQADGQVRGKSVQFNLKRPRKVERFRALCSRLGIIPKESALGWKKRNRLECSIGGDAVERCLKLLGDDKQFGPWLLNFSPETLHNFLRELPHWDGWITYGGKAMNYSSKYRNNTSWVATIGHLLGYLAYEQPLKSGAKIYYKVSLKHQDGIGINASKHIKLTVYRGRLYCPTLKSGFFLARSDGKIFITGNSEAKDAEEIIKYAKGLDALWTYNGLDCCVTRELVDVLYKELESRGLLGFYFQHYVAMLEPLLRTMRHGIRVDKKKQTAWAKKLLQEVDGIREELKQAAGEELFGTKAETFYREPTAEEWEKLLTKGWRLGMGELLPTKDSPPKPSCIDREARQRIIDETDCTYMISGKYAGQMRCHREALGKGFSNKKLHKFFYETLGAPKQRKLGMKDGQKTWKASTDEGALRKLTKKFPNKVGNWANLVLAVREKQKEAGYLKGAWDKDGRIRCSYKMITEAGRLASSKNPMRRGYNLQNIKR